MTELQKTTVDILAEVHKRQNENVKAEVAEKEDYVKDRPEVGETFDEFTNRMLPKITAAINAQMRLHPTHGNQLMGEMYDAAITALAKTYKNFNPSKGYKIDTLFGKVFRNELNNTYAKEMQTNTDNGTKNLSLDKMNEEGDALYESVADSNGQGNFDDASFANNPKEFERRVEEFKKTLKPQDRRIMELHLQELPPSKIARAAGVYEKNKDKIASRIDKLRHKAIEDWGLKLHVTKIEQINQKFNNDVEQQINGKLPSGYIYQLGTPSDILLSTGIPDLPIELSAKRLLEKSIQKNHPFNIADLKNLPEALKKPVAIFEYGDKNKAQNIIVEIQSGRKNFLVGLSLNYNRDGLDVNSIRGLFPKDLHKWLMWIQKGNALYIDKEKVQNLITQQRTNLADVSNLDLNSINSIIDNFENTSDKIEKNQKKLHITRPRQQINPIVKDGEVN